MNFLTGLLNRIGSPEDLIVSSGKLCVQLYVAQTAVTAGEATVELGGETFESEALRDTALADLTKRLNDLKLALIGNIESDADEERCQRLGAAVVKHGFARSLVQVVMVLPLEPRKDATHVFSNLVRRDIGDFAQHVADDEMILDALVHNLDGPPDLAVSCSAMIREAAKAEVVAAALLESDSFWKFFTTYVHVKNFDVAADAFEILKFLLTGFPARAAAFIAHRYDTFFQHYNTLLEADNYVTCRESVRLLGEVLLDRANFNSMMKYIGSRDNLKILMILLRNKKIRIQIEAFHVFKVFVANPRKPPEIVKILHANKDKLVAYLKNFTHDKADDQFNEEKALIIETLQALDTAEP
ncbi:Mo25-like protein [Pelagophyceae sp. CCMP2097]|nr:Mo25-like protein [Pelagophyceae sp. CCMP2097]